MPKAFHSAPKVFARGSAEDEAATLYQVTHGLEDVHVRSADGDSANLNLSTLAPEVTHAVLSADDGDLALVLEGALEAGRRRALVLELIPSGARAFSITGLSLTSALPDYVSQIAGGVEITVNQSVTALLELSSAGYTLRLEHAGDVPVRQYAHFSARNAAGTAQSIPDATFTRLTDAALDVVDSGSTNFNEFAVFTAPRDGWYSFQGGFVMDLDGLPTSNVIMALHVNGTRRTLLGRNRGGGGYFGVSGSVTVQLQANDTVTAYAYQNTGGSLSTQSSAGYVWFSGSELP